MVYIPYNYKLIYNFHYYNHSNFCNITQKYNSKIVSMIKDCYNSNVLNDCCFYNLNFISEFKKLNECYNLGNSSLYITCDAIIQNNDYKNARLIIGFVVFFAILIVLFLAYIISKRNIIKDQDNNKNIIGEKSVLLIN